LVHELALDRGRTRSWKKPEQLHDMETSLSGVLEFMTEKTQG